MAKRVFQVHWVEPDTGEVKRKMLVQQQLQGLRELTRRIEQLEHSYV